MRGRVMRGGWAWSALVAVPAVVFASGCASKVGEPSAAVPADSSSGSATSAAQPSATGGALDGLRACDLLTASEAEPLGIAEPGVDNGALAGTGTSRCEWSKPFVNGDGGFALSVVVRPEQTIGTVKVLSGWSSENGEFNGRSARILKQVRAGGASCMLAIALGESSRIDIGATGDSTDQTCGLVNDVASIIEPKLPKE